MAWQALLEPLTSLLSDRLQLHTLETALLEMMGDVLSALPDLLVMAGVMAAGLLTVVPAPYGRWAAPGWGPTVPARIGWIVQECPSFIVPLIILSRTAPPLSNAVPWTVQLTASAFLLHYAHRAFMYPLFVRREKRTPALVCVLAFSFCTVNGYLQVRADQAFCDGCRLSDRQLAWTL